MRTAILRGTVNALLVLASTGVALLVLECAIRIFHPQPLAAVARSPRLGWLHPPNSDLLYERQEFRVPVHFSSAGLRDREYPFQKPPGTVRVAWLGDSFVEALQVPFDSCAAKRVEAALNAAAAPGVHFEVLNFGVSGYGTCQQLLLLEELALRFEPDWVLSQYYANDLDDDVRVGLCALDSAGVLHEVVPPVRAGRARLAAAVKSVLFRHSELAVFVHSRRRRGGGGPAAANAPAAVPEAGGTPAGGCPGQHRTLEFRLSLRDLPPDGAAAVRQHAATWARMQDVCAAHGAHFLGVLGVSRPQIEPAEFAAALAANGCNPAAHDGLIAPARLAAAARARGVDVLELVPAFQTGVAHEFLHFRIDGHWNSAGHRVAAGAICEGLRARGILRTEPASKGTP